MLLNNVFRGWVMGETDGTIGETLSNRGLCWKRCFCIYQHLPLPGGSSKNHCILLYFQPTCVLAAVFTDPFHRQKTVFKQTKTYKTNVWTVLGDTYWCYTGHIKKEGVWFCLFIVHYRGAAIQFIPIANSWKFSHFPISWSFFNINSLVAIVMNFLF